MNQQNISVIYFRGTALKNKMQSLIKCKGKAGGKEHDLYYKFLKL